MNKKPMIIVGILFGIIIIGLIVYLVLSLTTDIFKTAKEMFNTYFTPSINAINNMTDLSKEQEYVKTLSESNYRDNLNIKLKYINNDEKTERFGISSNGITNNSANKAYKSMKIKYGENYNIMNLEYLKENQTYGILFADVVKQFVAADIEEWEDLLNIIGIDKSQIQQYDFSEILDLLINKKDAIEKICESYIKSLNDNKFQKKKNTQVTLNNGEEKRANSYLLHLSKDETKKLYLDILKELGKQGEINEITTTKRTFSETDVVIYEADKKIIRMTIEVENKQIRIDFNENGINIKYNDITTEEIKTYNIELNKDESGTKIQYNDSYNNTINLNYNITEDISKKNAEIEIDIKNDYLKELNLVMTQEMEESNTEIEGISKSFGTNKNINLSKLKTDNKNTALNSLLQKIDVVLIKRNNPINSKIINLWISLNKELENKYQGIKEQQKILFNNQFLAYRGKDVKKEIIYNLLELAGRNMEKYNTVGEESFNINISEGIQNSKSAEEIKNIIQKSRYKYNVDFGFDSDGKINLVKIQGYLDR